MNDTSDLIKEVDEKTKNPPPFKKLLDDSTGLLTCFGIFNALTLFATTIELKILAITLSFTFAALSCLVLYELVMIGMEYRESGSMYFIYSTLLLMAQLCFIVYLFHFYILFMAFIVLVLLYLGYSLLLIKYLGRLVILIIRKKVNKNKAKWIAIGMTISAMIIAVPCTIYSFRLLVLILKQFPVFDLDSAWLRFT